MNESTAHPAHPYTEDHDQDECPHVCTDGVIYLGHLVEDPGSGEEVEDIEAVPCCRCAEAAR